MDKISLWVLMMIFLEALRQIVVKCFKFRIFVLSPDVLYLLAEIAALLMVEVYLGENKRNYEYNNSLGVNDEYFLEILKQTVAKCVLIQNFCAVS
jgi:hypothetical protein